MSVSKLKGLTFYSTCKLTSQPVTVSWMLVKDRRHISQRQKILLLTAVVRGWSASFISSGTVLNYHLATMPRLPRFCPMLQQHDDERSFFKLWLFWNLFDDISSEEHLWNAWTGNFETRKRNGLMWGLGLCNSEVYWGPIPWEKFDTNPFTSLY